MKVASFEKLDNSLTPVIVKVGDRETPVWIQQRCNAGKYQEQVKYSGCGHTCAAMMATLLGKKITPHEEFELCVECWGEPNSKPVEFTEYPFITVSGIVEILTKLGVKAKYYPIKPIGVKKATEHMLSEVKNGKLACFISVPSESFPENPFSKGHHYVLIVGFMEDGKILIANSSVKHQPEIEGINIVDAETIEKALSPVADPLPNRTWGVMENLDEACGYIIAE